MCVSYVCKNVKCASTKHNPPPWGIEERPVWKDRVSSPIRPIIGRGGIARGIPENETVILIVPKMLKRRFLSGLKNYYNSRDHAFMKDTADDNSG